MQVFHLLFSSFPLAARVNNPSQNFKVLVMPGGPFCKSEHEKIDPTDEGARQELWSTLVDIQNLDFGKDSVQVSEHQVFLAVPSEKNGIERMGRFHAEFYGPDVIDL